MVKRMLIDASHAEETRVVVISGNRLEEFDFETSTRKQLKGNIYLAKVTRVEPSLQAAFVEYGGNRHGFLSFSEIHPDYYQIPMADREALFRAQIAAEEAEERREAAFAERRAKQAAAERARDGSVAEADEPSDQAREASSDEPERENEAAPFGDEAGQPGADEDHHFDQTTPEGDPADEPAADTDKADAGDTDDEAAGPPREPGSAALTWRSGPRLLRSPAGDGSGGGSPDQQATPDDVAPSPEAGIEPSFRKGTEGSAPDAPPPQEVGATESAAEEEAAPLPYDRPMPAEPSEDEPGAFGELDDNPSEQGVGEMRAEPAAEGTTQPADQAAEGGQRAGGVEELGGDELDDLERRRIEISRSLLGRRYKIQEVIKRRQILLIQVVKEERGTKGAALTTYLSLAGRYCVLMPNAIRGGGISRKIVNAEDRKRLKSITSELSIPARMGLIVRTAGLNRSKAEIKRDFDYLLRQWESIRDLTLSSSAPCLINEEGNLIKRSIRDLYTKDIDEIQIEGDEGYRIAKDFMRTLIPSHTAKVQPYRDRVPLFVRYQIESQLDSMYKPHVPLRSGGYLVINQTEALVAIDVNSGRATRERNIEETAYKTNLEAADEVARQLRLRDLAGLIVIDFIDMEDSRNQRAVERRVKDAMKHDRARIQLGRISPFGLLEMSRQRLRPSIAEASMEACVHCGGAGLLRSTESSAVHVLRGIEEEGLKGRAHIIRVHVATRVALYILNSKRPAVNAIEARYELEISFKPDDSLIPPDHKIEVIEARSAMADAVAPKAAEAPPIEPDELRARPDEVADAEPEAEAEAMATPVPTQDSTEGAHRRRRRRGGEQRGRPGHAAMAPSVTVDPGEPTAASDGPAESLDEPPQSDEPAPLGATEPGDERQGQAGLPRRRRRGRRGGRRRRGWDSLPLRDAPLNANGDQAPAPEMAPHESGMAEPQSAENAPAEATPEAPAGEPNADGNEVRRRRRRRGGRHARGGDFGRDAAPSWSEQEQPAAGMSAPPVPAPPLAALESPASSALSTPPGWHAPAVEPAIDPWPLPTPIPASPSQDTNGEAAIEQQAADEGAAPHPQRRGWWQRMRPGK